jgi:Immunity protein 50
LEPDLLDQPGGIAFLRNMNEVETIYARIPGGPDLLAWFGHVPDFHDAEVVSFNLRRRAPSMLSIHAWNRTNEVDSRGHLVRDRHAVVTFALEDIMDLQLKGFSHQNVISGLQLRRAPERPDRRPFYGLDPSPNDYEIELEPRFGLDGIIRCRRVLVDFIPGKPRDVRGWSTATRRARE